MCLLSNNYSGKKYNLFYYIIMIILKSMPEGLKRDANNVNDEIKLIY